MCPVASKRARFHCELAVGGAVLKLLPGSHLYLADQCLDCRCDSSGLQCCGFGRHAGPVAIPDQCEQIQDGCHDITVRKGNQSRDCSNETIDFRTLSNDLPHPDNRYGINGGSTTKLTMTSVPVPTTPPAIPTNAALMDTLLSGEFSELINKLQQQLDAGSRTGLPQSFPQQPAMGLFRPDPQVAQPSPYHQMADIWNPYWWL
ncbi:uncharacterized protein LOC127836836 [Dreissena polymorpha]|uniref:Uncharacterized protein n=1 Tax=Dreissena polymorpha TaxID=45954 RepID=A0A9D4FC44_DREPO|nr:uncharacterized protein LOC127836836 [Dreissena polymorpha]KAH3795552.1 hypothetical protein DPMN_149106 [Dreissena polymorpha]